MRSNRFVPRRYQLTKDGARIAAGGHPWIFRSHLSTAVQAFRDGQWMKLVGPNNDIVGYGMYEANGLIGIRVLTRGPAVPDVVFLRSRLDKAIARRTALRQFTDAFRAVHGENDGFPGVVVDVYGTTAVLQTYSASVDSLGRWAAAYLAKQLGLKNVVWKLPAKRQGGREGKGVRILRGNLPDTVSYREGKLSLTVGIGSGQKSGTFLDLRGLRKWIASQPLAGKRVLNLFCYTGTLGLAAETAGAREVWNVDIAPGALEVAKKFHCRDPKRQRYIAADVFDWLGKLPEGEMFDLIIVDPPNMASESSQVPGALRAYKRLYLESLKHLAPNGRLVGACCTSRIPRETFEKSLYVWLAELEKRGNLKPEDDHPVGFAEGDYLKILIFERGRGIPRPGGPRRSTSPPPGKKPGGKPRKASKGRSGHPSRQPRKVGGL